MMRAGGRNMETEIGAESAPSWCSLTIAWGIDGTNFDTIEATLGHYFQRGGMKLPITVQITETNGEVYDASLYYLFNAAGEGDLDNPALMICQHDEESNEVGVPEGLALSYVKRLLIY
jgi:hypothetical protein